MGDQETKLDGFVIQEFDSTAMGEVAVDPESGETMADRDCIGFIFKHAWWPKGCNEAGFWGGCSLISWNYPPGNYKRPDGSVLKWRGGWSPFRKTC